MKRQISCLVPALAILVLTTACMTPPGDTVASQRQSVHNMRHDTLTKLYKIRPGTRAIIRRAAGYGVGLNEHRLADRTCALGTRIDLITEILDGGQNLISEILDRV